MLGAAPVKPASGPWRVARCKQLHVATVSRSTTHGMLGRLKIFSSLATSTALITASRQPLFIAQRSVAVSCMSDQTNPNNDAFGRARGYKRRPNDWEDEVARLRKQGKFTAAANAAVATSAAEMEYRGKVMRVIEQAAKDTLGSETQVFKAGSQAKKTNVAGSDLDVFLQTKSPMTEAQKTKLADRLRAQPFQLLEVKETPLHIVVKCLSHGLTVDLRPTSKHELKQCDDSRSEAAFRIVAEDERAVLGDLCRP